MSFLLPHINDRSDATPSSGTITTALTHRAKVLQEENDELYELLKSGETGRLKEDVRALRRLVERLEGALKGQSSAHALFLQDLPNTSYCRVAPSHCVSLVRAYTRGPVQAADIIQS